MTSTMCKCSAAGLSKIASFEIGLTCNLYSRLEDVMMHVSTAQHSTAQHSTAQDSTHAGIAHQRAAAQMSGQVYISLHSLHCWKAYLYHNVTTFGV